MTTERNRRRRLRQKQNKFKQQVLKQEGKEAHKAPKLRAIKNKKVKKLRREVNDSSNSSS